MRARYWVILGVVAFALLVIWRQTRPIRVEPITYTFNASECEVTPVEDPNAGPGLKTTCTHIEWRRDTEPGPEEQHEGDEGPMGP
jgi:hypothetical protein